MFDINEVPYAEWLEKSLQAIVPLKPVSLCFAATMPDGGGLHRILQRGCNGQGRDRAQHPGGYHNGHYPDQCRDHQRHDRALRRG